MWTRSCCASLLGLWNRLSQDSQTCTMAPAQVGCSSAPDARKAAVLAAVFGGQFDRCIF